MSEQIHTRACREFTRAQVLREAAARAGNGLPLIEPGMPLPAGSGLSRRSFLLRGGAFMLTLYGALNYNPLRLSDAIAQAAAGPPDPVLVSVFLDGGADSLSVLAPVEDATYRRLRPTLALSPDIGTPFGDDTRLRWNPAADGLRILHEEGKLAVAPSIGYTPADQSHFTSRHYWEVGDTDPRLQTGWLGRYLDAVGAPDNPLQGLSVDYSLSPALAPSKVPVAALANPRSYRFGHRNVWGEVDEAMIDAIERMGQASQGSRDNGLRTAADASAQSMKLRRQLLPFATEEDNAPPGIASPVTYPKDEDFGEQLQFVAAMLAIGLPLRCVAIRAAGGYDTHDQQRESFDKDLKSAADCLLAFQRDLEARGLADRVLVHIWSEFGRRPEENGSNGCDHGAAGMAMVMGSRVRRQLLGEFTGVDVLDEDDNMRPSMDFRALHGAILDQWFNFDAARVIPKVRSYNLPAILN
ncbi:MAG: DUF1501 domain-containing protein [Actinobacteria bacterium]|nr:DUF1501 domain-containing protein [Actinomycetota bacterium]